jgi:GNAT superfamily N-acetyltransferase
MLTIREPWPSEAPLVRALLPEACATPSGRRWVLAFEESGSVAGAASWVEEEDGRTGVAIEVVPSKRRRGIGSRILEALGPGELKAAAPDAAAPFLEARGFRRTGGQTTVESDLDYVVAALRGFPEVPELQEGPADPIAVALLYRRWIVGDEHLPEALTAARLLSDPGLKIFTATRDGQVRAFLMWSRQGELVTVEAWASDPALRGTALNTGLLVGFVRQLHRAGARRARFSWGDHVIQTPRLARRFAAREVGRVTFWTRHSL